MRKNFKVAIFDLDGTLTDTLEDLYLSTNYALAQMGLPQRTLSEIRRFVGNGIGKLVQRAMGEPTEKQYQQCLEIFRRHYVVHCMDHTRLYDGVCELLLELRKRNVKMAIVSNKLQSGVDELQRRFFKDLVTVAIGEREGVCRKPAPDMVEIAINDLGVDKEDCLYIGDSDVDICTARNAGLPCVSVLWGFRGEEELRQAGGQEFAEEPSQLLQFFEE